MTALASPLDDQPIAVLPSTKTLKLFGAGWTAWAGVVTSVAILATVAWHLGDEQLFGLVDHLPANPGFWLVFAAFYMTQPLSDWVIFRRLWNLPIGGLVPLMKKRVSNELLLGYSGEVYFYAWARQHLKLAASPFGAVKDVTILSALMGNLVTLVLLGATAPFLVDTMPAFVSGANGWALFGSLAVVIACSLGVMLFRNRVLSLTRAELRFTALNHLARIVIGLGLSAWMWHLALPSVALGWWVVLATWRQLVSRLPLLPNKDVMFAAVAMFLVGEQNGIAALMALIAALLLAADILVGIGLAIEQVLRGRA